MTMQPSRDIDAARRRAERIRIKARSITEQYSDLRALVDEAERCEDHLTLGYPSWTAYVADLFGDEPLRLPRDSRIPMSNMLAEKGMSTRAIGSVLGVHHDTVADDIKAGVGNPTPVPEPAAPDHIDLDTGEVVDAERYPQARRAPWPERRDDPEPERIDRLTGEAVPAPTFKPLDVTNWTPEELDAQIAADDAVIESYERATVPAPVKVVGLDGKTYTRPEPKTTEPRRAALPPMVQSAGWDLTKSIERLQRLAADDRFNAHKKEMAPHLRSHLTSAIEACQDLLDRISN